MLAAPPSRKEYDAREAIRPTIEDAELVSNAFIRYGFRTRIEAYRDPANGAEKFRVTAESREEVTI